jgi:hypothetical protein
MSNWRGGPQKGPRSDIISLCNPFCRLGYVYRRQRFRLEKDIASEAHLIAGHWGSGHMPTMMPGASPVLFGTFIFCVYRSVSMGQRVVRLYESAIVQYCT